MTQTQASRSVRVGLVGLGKMGLSHLAIVRPHPQVESVVACDANSYVTDVLGRQAGLTCYADLDTMLEAEALDAVVISTPSRLHADMVGKALRRGLDVFCEKPFVLDVADGERLVAEARARGAVTQVGYHCRFVGAFQEAARVVRSGALGRVHHVRAEAYGPVVLRERGGTWRSARREGGGALYDYACHAIDLVHCIFKVPQAVGGVVRHSVFSRDVEDEIYCSLYFDDGASGQLCVNWSDESFRKMSTRLSVWGSAGRLTVDRQECQIYLREAHPALIDTPAGWTVRYTTELTPEVWYYLRGEEYSAQIDHFVRNVAARRTDGENSFESALQADRVVQMILAANGSEPARATGVDRPVRSKAAGWWRRLVTR